MKKKELREVVENLMYSDSKFVKGNLVIEDIDEEGDRHLYVEDKGTDEMIAYCYYDAYDEHRNSASTITNFIWEEWDIRSY